jgi:peptidyl-tRNA hydrolase
VQAKITLMVDNEAEMLSIAAAAKVAGLPTAVIQDAGK